MPTDALSKHCTFTTHKNTNEVEMREEVVVDIAVRQNTTYFEMAGYTRMNIKSPSKRYFIFQISALSL